MDSGYFIALKYPIVSLISVSSEVSSGIGSSTPSVSMGTSGVLLSV